MNMRLATAPAISGPDTTLAGRRLSRSDQGHFAVFRFMNGYSMKVRMISEWTMLVER